MEPSKSPQNAHQTHQSPTLFCILKMSFTSPTQFAISLVNHLRMSIQLYQHRVIRRYLLFCRILLKRLDWMEVSVILILMSILFSWSWVSRLLGLLLANMFGGRELHTASALFGLRRRWWRFLVPWKSEVSVDLVMTVFKTAASLLQQQETESRGSLATT